MADEAPAFRMWALRHCAIAVQGVYAKADIDRVLAQNMSEFTRRVSGRQ